MLKLMIKSNNEGVNVLYKGRNTNTLEHIIAMAKLYREIKENKPDFTDEEIHDAVEKILELPEEN